MTHKKRELLCPVLLLPAARTRHSSLFYHEKLAHLVLNKLLRLIFFFSFCWLYIRSSVIVFSLIQIMSSFYSVLLLAV